MSDIPKDIVAVPFYYAEQNDCLESLIRCVSKMSLLLLDLAPYYSSLPRTVWKVCLPSNLLKRTPERFWIDNTNSICIFNL